MEQTGPEREREPERDDVRVDGSPVRCPFCHEGVDVATEEWVACAGCLARHHGDCWGEGGRCGACKGTEALKRDAPVASAPPAPAPPDTSARGAGFTRLFEGEVGDEIDEVIVGEARRRLGADGRFERIGRTMTWTSSITPGPGVTVTLTSRDGSTTLTVRDVASVKDPLHPFIVFMCVLMLALISSLFGIATSDVTGSARAGLAVGLLAFAPLVGLFLFKALPWVKRARAEGAARVDALAAALEQEVRSRVRPVKKHGAKGE